LALAAAAATGAAAAAAAVVASAFAGERSKAIPIFYLRVMGNAEMQETI
jgi:hypothetical protein